MTAPVAPELIFLYVVCVLILLLSFLHLVSQIANPPPPAAATVEPADQDQDDEESKMMISKTAEKRGEEVLKLGDIVSRLDKDGNHDHDREYERVLFVSPTLVVTRNSMTNFAYVGEDGIKRLENTFHDDPLLAAEKLQGLFIALCVLDAHSSSSHVTRGLDLFKILRQMNALLPSPLEDKLKRDIDGWIVARSIQQELVSKLHELLVVPGDYQEVQSQFEKALQDQVVDVHQVMDEIYGEKNNWEVPKFLYIVK
jgi:hypothetical protein